MKFATLLALGLVANVHAAYDFDGDGIDDMEIEEEEAECEGRECK